MRGEGIGVPARAAQALGLGRARVPRRRRTTGFFRENLDARLEFRNPDETRLRGRARSRSLALRVSGVAEATEGARHAIQAHERGGRCWNARLVMAVSEQRHARFCAARASEPSARASAQITPRRSPSWLVRATSSDEAIFECHAGISTPWTRRGRRVRGKFAPRLITRFGVDPRAASLLSRPRSPAASNPTARSAPDGT